MVIGIISFVVLLVLTIVFAIGSVKQIRNDSEGWSLFQTILMVVITVALGVSTVVTFINTLACLQ